jgi:hypothetical protein
VATIFIPGCSGRSVSVPTAAEIAEFVAKANMTLPSSAKTIGYFAEKGATDDALWLQVRVPAADLPAFLEKSPFKEKSLNPAPNEYLLGMFSAFWKTPPSKYRSGQVSLSGGDVLNILIDDGGPGDPVVYLMWHET